MNKTWGIPTLLLVVSLAGAAGYGAPENEALSGAADGALSAVQSELAVRVDAMKKAAARFRLVNEGGAWRCEDGYGRPGLNRFDWRTFRDLRDGECMDMRGLDLNHLDLGTNDLEGADMTGVDFTDADLAGVDMSHAVLKDAKLRGVQGDHMKLVGTDLGRADLRGADLSDSDMTGADLRGADVHDVDFSGAQLNGVRWEGAKYHTPVYRPSPDLDPAQLNEDH